MSTIPSLNLFNPTIAPDLKKTIRNNIISSGQVRNVRHNTRVTMNIIGSKNAKPCGRCGGAK